MSVNPISSNNINIFMLQSPKAIPPMNTKLIEF